MNSHSLKGKIWLTNFFFTRCQSTCPPMTKKISQLQKKLSDLKNVKQLSISMDPEHDNSELLKNFASQYQADAEKWHFLTGKKEEVIRICKDIFNLPAGSNPDLHSTRIVLVDQNGKIRGYYDSLDDNSMKNLEAHVRFLADKKINIAKK